MDEAQKSPRTSWIVLLVAVPVLGGLGLLLHTVHPASAAWFPRCGFHRFTGFHCPGCGGMRATHHLLNGQWAEALSMNLLLFLLAPLLGWIALQGLRGKSTGLSRRMGVTVLALVLGFWILRNLPGLGWLAPGQ